MVPKLSHHKLGVCEGENPISFSEDINKSNSLEIVSTQYSDSLKDQETTCCFPEHHEIKLGPIKI